MAECQLAAAEAPATKRVLMLFSEEKALPVNLAVEQALEAERQSHRTNRIEFYAKSLDAQFKVIMHGMHGEPVLPTDEGFGDDDVRP